MNQVKTLFLLAILFFSSYAKADQLLTVKIGKLMDAQQGSVVELPVFLTNSDYAIKSFDFLLTFDTKVFFLQSVIPATTTDNGICYWDRFDVYDCTKKDKDSLCPRGTIRISATVKGNNSGVLNFLDDAKELEIFRMKFMITNDRTFEGRTYPVHFVWNECWDNTISVDLPETGPGNETLYADSVLFENSQLVRQIELPATANFSESCFSGDNRSQKRVIDFHHGYINLCCYHMEDFSGDINLNGISNEVSDLLLFQDYFLDGISVFTVNPAGQIANTDVNYDNLTLKLEDLVHLNAIVKGDAIPFKKTQPLINGTMINDTNLNRVYMKADSAVYAVWIQLDGNVVLEPRIWSELFRFNHVDSVTDVLLFGINANSQSKIPLFQYKTKTTIKNAQAATRNGNRIDLTFDQ